MAFQIKRKGPGHADLFTEDKFINAIRRASGLIRERAPKARTTVTNLKTGETMGEDEIEEAALSVRLKQRPDAT